MLAIFDKVHHGSYVPLPDVDDVLDEAMWLTEEGLPVTTGAVAWSLSTTLERTQELVDIWLMVGLLEQRGIGPAGMEYAVPAKYWSTLH